MLPGPLVVARVTITMLLSGFGMSTLLCCYCKQYTFCFLQCGEGRLNILLVVWLLYMYVLWENATTT